MSQVKSEKTAIKKEPKSLGSQVDDVLNGTNKNSYVELSNETPKILQDIGVPNLPLFMTAKHTYLAINSDGKYKGENDHYHDLGKDLFLSIPKLLESPTMILQKDKNDIIAVLSWYDKNKNILICPIRINGTAQYNKITIEGNIAKSVYGKENLKNYINKNFKQEEESTIENYKLLKEKVNEFLEFKELNSLIVHSLISRIEVGYRDNPRTIKIYYKFIDDSISN